jgi:hypothetical protein
MYRALDSMLVYQFALHLHCNLLRLFYFSLFSQSSSKCIADLAILFKHSSINSYKSLANNFQLKHSIACPLHLIHVRCTPRCCWVACPLGPTYPSNLKCHASTLALSCPKLETTWAPDVNRRFLPSILIDNLLGRSLVSTY